jgi:hypothetical protein
MRPNTNSMTRKTVFMAWNDMFAQAESTISIVSHSTKQAEVSLPLWVVAKLVESDKKSQ